MLKQSSSIRTNRTKGLKVKHVLQVCVLLVVSIWLLNQLKHSFYKNADQKHGSEDEPGKQETEIELLKLGRKDIHPRVEDMAGQGREVEVGEDVEEIKPEETEDEGRGDGDDELDGHDEQERSDEEPEEVEDLIDVDDGDREEVSELQENDQKEKLHEGNDVMRKEQSMGNRVSTKPMEQSIQTVTSKPETVSMRKMKETEDPDIELVQTENSTNDADSNVDSDQRSQKSMTDPNSLNG